MFAAMWWIGRAAPSFLEAAFFLLIVTRFSLIFSLYSLFEGVTQLHTATFGEKPLGGKVTPTLSAVSLSK
jgi:hypothetical protein